MLFSSKIRAISSVGEKQSKLFFAVYTTCSAASAPPVWPPIPSATTASATPRW